MSTRTQVSIYAGLIAGLGSLAWGLGNDYFVVRCIVPGLITGLGYALGEWSALKRDQERREADYGRSW